MGRVKFWAQTVWLSRQSHNHRFRPTDKSQCGVTLAAPYTGNKPPQWATAASNDHTVATYVRASASLSLLYDTATSALELCSKSEAEWQNPCDLDLLKTDPSSEGWSSSKWNRHPRTSELPSPLCHLGPYTLDSWTSGHTDTHTQTHTHRCTHTCTHVQAHGLFVRHGASSSQLHSDVHCLQNPSGKRSHMIWPQGMSFSVRQSPICRVNLRLDKAFTELGLRSQGPGLSQEENTLMTNLSQWEWAQIPWEERNKGRREGTGATEDTDVEGGSFYRGTPLRHRPTFYPLQ